MRLQSFSTARPSLYTNDNALVKVDGPKLGLLNSSFGACHPPFAPRHTTSFLTSEVFLGGSDKWLWNQECFQHELQARTGQGRSIQIPGVDLAVEFFAA